MSPKSSWGDGAALNLPDNVIMAPGKVSRVQRSAYPGFQVNGIHYRAKRGLFEDCAGSRKRVEVLQRGSSLFVWLFG